MVERALLSDYISEAASVNQALLSLLYKVRTDPAVSLTCLCLNLCPNPTNPACPDPFPYAFPRLTRFSFPLRTLTLPLPYRTSSAAIVCILSSYWCISSTLPTPSYMWRGSPFTSSTISSKRYKLIIVTHISMLYTYIDT